MKGLGHEPTRDDTDVIGGRVGAQIIDLILMMVLFFVPWLGFFIVGAAVGGSAGTGAESEDGIANILAGIGFLLGSGAAIGYPFILEAIWDGRTVGKRVFGIKAVKERGDSVGVGSVVIRNLPVLSAFSWLAYLVALLSMAASDKRQRLFDRLAGTVVVKEPKGETSQPEAHARAPQEERSYRETVERAPQEKRPGRETVGRGPQEERPNSEDRNSSDSHRR